MWKITWTCVVFYAVCMASEVDGRHKSNKESTDKEPSEVIPTTNSLDANSPPVLKIANILDSKDTEQLLGAYRNVDESDLDSPEIKKYAEFSAQEIASRMNYPNGLSVVKVTKAKKQVVQGLNYILDLVVVPNKCDKESQDSNEQCPPGPCNEYLSCLALVYAIPWLEKQQLVESACKKDHSACHRDPPTKA